LLRLLGAMERAGVMPVGASVVLQDFKSLTVEQQARLRHPYFIAFQEDTSHLAFEVAVSASETSPFAATLVETADAVPAEPTPTQLPKAGSSLPLVWLLGGLFCSLALGLRASRAFSS